MIAHGRCWKFGDNIPTDQIVKADRVLLSLNEMAKHVLENLNPEFPLNVKPGDILVAGKHFGQSSGRAVAPKAIKATGVGAVVAEYAARLFYRNCFEIGLPILELPRHYGRRERRRHPLCRYGARASSATRRRGGSSMQSRSTLF